MFYAGTDPVKVGLVESFPRPGGRLTGVYSQTTDLTGKRIERPVTSLEELRAGLRALRPGEVDGYLHASDASMTSYADVIVDALRAKRVPFILQDRESVVRGALASYGLSYYAGGRLVSKYVHRVLLGANPADLPVEQMNRLLLVINLKTAKAMGLTIPPSLLARIDEIIE